MERMTPEKVSRMLPGWKVRVRYGDTNHDGTIAQQLARDMLFVADGDDTIQRFSHRDIAEGFIDVEILDTSGGMQIEVIEGPPNGDPRIEPEYYDLTHDNPIQSAPPTTIVAHPTNGYDEDEDEIEALRAIFETDHEDEPILRVRLPIAVTTIVALIEAITDEFPHAYADESDGDEILVYQGPR